MKLQLLPHLLLDLWYCGSARVRNMRSAEAPPLDQRPRRLATASHSTAPHGFTFRGLATHVLTRCCQVQDQ